MKAATSHCFSFDFAKLSLPDVLLRRIARSTYAEYRAEGEKAL